MRRRMLFLPTGKIIRLKLFHELLLGLADVGDIERGALRAANLDRIPAWSVGELKRAGGAEPGILALSNGLAGRERRNRARAGPFALVRLGDRRELVATDQVVPGVVWPASISNVPSTIDVRMPRLTSRT